MKTHKVYELINTCGTIEYVGETSNLENRIRQHFKIKPSTKHNQGKFYGRQDLTVNIAAELDTRTEALVLEGILKLEYGLEWTEKIRMSKVGSLNGRINGKKCQKLTDKDAEDIRNIYKIGSITQKQLAESYSVTQKTISLIVNNKRWI